MARLRVVSLLPSATEIVCALGSEDFLVGRSHVCDFPTTVSRLPSCTRSKVSETASGRQIDEEIKALHSTGSSLFEIDSGLLKSLRPDAILTQGQCDVCAVSLSDVQRTVESWGGAAPKIVSLAPQRFADLWNDIRTVAAALRLEEQGRDTVKALKNRVVSVIEKCCLLKRRPSVACVEWIEPLMAAGNWVPELVELAGGQNTFGKAGKHSPWMKWEELRERDPEVIILMPCGFDLPRTRAELSPLIQQPGWEKLRAVKSGRVYLTDGDHYFNRPGPRLVDSLEILGEILQPDLFPATYRGTAWEKL